MLERVVGGSALGEKVLASFATLTARSATPYDLRRTYANWLEAAGVMRTRRKLYLGHSAGDTTGLYELHEVNDFLAADGAKLREFAGLETAAPLRLEARNA